MRTQHIDVSYMHIGAMCTTCVLVCSDGRVVHGKANFVLGVLSKPDPSNPTQWCVDGRLNFLSRKAALRYMVERNLNGSAK